MTIRYSTFPRCQQEPSFVSEVVGVFEDRAEEIATLHGQKGKRIASDQILGVVRPGLSRLGFSVESGRKQHQKIIYTVLPANEGRPEHNYELDAWHKDWHAVLEVDRSRAIGGGAIFRNLIRAFAIDNLDYLFLVVPQFYSRSNGRSDPDYQNTVTVAQVLYGPSCRIEMPYSLCVIGYG